VTGSGQTRHLVNSRRYAASLEQEAHLAMGNLQPWDDAVAEIRTWPGYAPTPLRSLDALANRVGVRKIYYKDESQRFGRSLGSFKALGAPYAVQRLLADHIGAKTGRRPSSAELRSGVHRALTRTVTVCVATDGNQGRGLAWGAQQFGCRCVVYIHAHVSEGRKAAMEAFGAEVIRVSGEYEASVARCRADATANGWHFVSSTSWDNYQTPLSRHVMQGYMIMIDEAVEQLPTKKALTHVFAQAGVGSIPAAIYMGLLKNLGRLDLRSVVIEPNEADCVFLSLANGKPTPAAGSLKTIMAGLACREVSPAAWSILHWIVSDAVTISDDAARAAMKVLADGHGDVPIVAGESAVGGVATLLEAATNPTLRTALGLKPDSEVLLFGCEGATDPQIYQSITGETPDAVFARQPA
jgi:diaminopropionate ammonia-lyase